MKVAIVGYAVENQAALRYWQQKNADITICDQNPDTEVPEGIASRLGPSYLDHLDEFDVIVRTVGMHPKLILEKNPLVAEKITTAVNLFFSECKKPIIGITGTKGKGTTSTLIQKILEAAGKKVLLGGNIGLPMLDLLPAVPEADYVVLELSSFQLIDIEYSPAIGVCLMVAPEHLNWHEDIDEYITAKQQLFIHQQAEDIAIYNAQNDNSARVVKVSNGKQIPYLAAPGAEVIDTKIVIESTEICDVGELRLLGKHNWQNVCAAVTAVWQIVPNVEAIRSVLTTFTGLEHRLELVREMEGVKYYDDSFGTTPETAIVAIEAFEQPKVVILGGSDKGATYENLALTVKNYNVRQVIVIGDTGPAIRKALQSVGFNDIVDGPKTMSEIVSLAQKYAKNGDIVLLSTGCASFGLFENYKDRGEQFKKAVKEL